MEQVLTAVSTGETFLFTEQIHAEQAAAGSGTTGHASTIMNVIGGGTVQEKYSFVALGTEPFPTGKGELEWHAFVNIEAGAVHFEIHADVDCVVVSDNQAWVSGPIERFLVDGVPQPLPRPHAIFRVRDNGVNENTPDEASQLLFAVPQACRSRPFLTLRPSEDGAIQVRPMPSGG